MMLCRAALDQDAEEEDGGWKRIPSPEVNLRLMSMTSKTHSITDTHPTHPHCAAQRGVPKRAWEASQSGQPAASERG